MFHYRSRRSANEESSTVRMSGQINRNKRDNMAMNAGLTRGSMWRLSSAEPGFPETVHPADGCLRSWTGGCGWRPQTSGLLEPETVPSRNTLFDSGE